MTKPSPPARALATIERLAGCSPCQKSKRGVVVYEHEPFRLWGSGFNEPPKPMRCDGSEACRRDCAKICVHAEQMALKSAIEHVSHEHKAPDAKSPLEGMDLLHAKVVDGAIVPGGPPSCWQCSREVLDLQLGGVWLFEERPPGMVGPRYGLWVYYTAEEFHRATLVNCGLHVGDLPRMVHALWGGYAICDSYAGAPWRLGSPPSQWGRGQSWISLEDIARNMSVLGVAEWSCVPASVGTSVWCPHCARVAPGVLSGLKLIGADAATHVPRREPDTQFAEAAATRIADARAMSSAAFVECAACSLLPGSPGLCASCLVNRDNISRLQRMVMGKP